MRNLDEFAAALTTITADATRHAITSAGSRALMDAARAGDEASVRRIAEGMSTAELNRVKRQLER